MQPRSKPCSSPIWKHWHAPKQNKAKLKSIHNLDHDPKNSVNIALILEAMIQRIDP